MILILWFIFNILFITGICALSAKTTLIIDFYPITRDCLYYVVSVLVLMLFLIDGEINTFESIFLLILYANYILAMYYNNEIEKYIKSKGMCCLSLFLYLFKNILLTKQLKPKLNLI